jgi:hypothetical protein
VREGERDRQREGERERADYHFMNTNTIKCMRVMHCYYII